MVWLGLALWLVDWVDWVGLGWVDGRQACMHWWWMMDDLPLCFLPIAT